MAIFDTWYMACKAEYMFPQGSTSDMLKLVPNRPASGWLDIAEQASVRAREPRAATPRVADASPFAVLYVGPGGLQAWDPATLDT